MSRRNRGRKKPSLRSLSQLPVTQEEKHELSELFSTSREPIVTAILGQILLENELDGLLRSHFAKRDDDTWNTLTDDKAPLGTFHNKIIAGYAFGIYDDVIRDGLNTIRKIRNAFAHSKKRLNFSHKLITNELKSISIPQKGRKQLINDLTFIATEASKGNNRGHFCFILLCMNIENQLLRKQTKRMQAKTRRLTKRHRQLLLDALLNPRISTPGDFWQSLSDRQNADPTPLVHGILSAMRDR